jgi:DNA-binding HxlR family transcriptional regulator
MQTTAPISYDDELCPSSMVPVRMHHKWGPLVLGLLDRGNLPFNEIQRELPRIGPKELTRALRSLERDGFISRPSGGYGLTPLGRSLLALLLTVFSWTNEHWDEVVDARESASAPDSSEK